MSEFIKREYIPITHPEFNNLKIEVRYDMGGYNMLTHTPKPRGYYVSVTPVERKGMWETTTAFTGYYNILKEVTRKSKKAETEALNSVTEIAQTMVNRICDEIGIDRITIS